jgi:peptide chain release factor subunit 1
MISIKNKYTIIHITGEQTIFATLHGDECKIIKKYSTILPNSNSRKGGQSALRFSRLRDEARFNYVTKVIDLMKELFPNGVAFVSGSDELRNNLIKRIQGMEMNKYLKCINEINFNKVITIIPTILKDHQKVKDTQLLKEFFNRLSIQDKTVIGERNVNFARESDAIDVLIICESVIDLYHESVNKIQKVYVCSNTTHEGAIFEQCGGIGAYLKFNIYIEDEE